MKKDLTKGSVMGSMLCFAVPMIIGNLLQQCYNVADTLIVGQYLGKNAPGCCRVVLYPDDLFDLHLLGLCMGSGVVFSIRIWPAG